MRIQQYLQLVLAGVVEFTTRSALSGIEAAFYSAGSPNHRSVRRILSYNDTGDRSQSRATLSTREDTVIHCMVAA